MRRSPILIAAAFLVLPATVGAQNALTAASGKLSVLQGATGAMTLDFSDSKLGMTFAGGDDLVSTRTRFRWWEVSVAGAATKGTRSLLSGGKVDPAFEASAAWTLSGHLKARPTPCPTPEEGDECFVPSYWSVYVVGQAALASQKWVRAEGDAIKEVGKTIGGSYGLGLGFNYGFTYDHVLGLSVVATRLDDSVGGFKEGQYCSTRATGVTQDGAEVSVADCEDRYLGAPRDLSGATARVDFMTRLRRGEKVTLGGLMSASAVYVDGSDTQLNVAVGPTIHPATKPGLIYAALLFEYADATRTVEQDFDDRFSIRIHVGVPFDVF